MKAELKIKWQTMTIIALGVLVGLTTDFAQTSAGDYKKVETTDAAVVAAADFAVEAQSERAEAGIELLSIEQAERRTAAGEADFKLCIQVNIVDLKTDKPYEKFVSVEISVNAKNEYALRSWTETESCGAKQ